MTAALFKHVKLCLKLLQYTFQVGLGTVRGSTWRRQEFTVLFRPVKVGH